ncbi:hypothetical protein NDU88_003335 [Pleurodeles waltl]|uniref:Uncharacterized protein n=1 Tax=Pleurodeles waltl TaxID=8319 RepID=A0AAV7W6L0_PLEWA|nr:hypothetical protein NDU88_003335 [Pleurodeles waltl]
MARVARQGVAQGLSALSASSAFCRAHPTQVFASLHTSSCRRLASGRLASSSESTAARPRLLRSSALNFQH